MTLLKPQQNFHSRLKFPVHSISKICFKKIIKMIGAKLTVGRRLVIGICWYQSTNRRFIYSHLFIHYHKGGLTIGYYQTRVNTFLEFISNITDIFRELLPNNTTHFSRHQWILAFFRELLANNTTKFSKFRINIKQCWHF